MIVNKIFDKQWRGLKIKYFKVVGQTVYGRPLKKQKSIFRVIYDRLASIPKRNLEYKKMLLFNNLIYMLHSCRVYIVI
jgi:hypothetical protein